MASGRCNKERRSVVNNEQYETCVNRLIAAAFTLANRRCGPNPGVRGSTAWVTWAKAWDRVYHAEMDRLTSRAGLRRLAYQGPQLVLVQ